MSQLIMMKPYKVVAENAGSITYEYNPAYAWAMYSILGLYITGLFAGWTHITGICIGLMLLYFIAKFGLGFQAERTIRRGVLKSAVTVSGRKASFKNPLRFHVILHEKNETS